MTSKRVGLLAIAIAAAVLWAIPSASSGKADLRKAGDALRQVTSDLGTVVDNTVAKTDEALKMTRAKAGAAVEKTKQSAKSAKAEKRATATDPARQPPAHGTDPHGQGGVSVVDVNPSAERPLASDPTGQASGEDVIVGRTRGEKVNGAYRGRITIATLFGNELIRGVETAPGETKNGPLEPLQAGILDPLCRATNQQACLSALTADSKTTAEGSANDFAVARASVLGLGVGAAESQGAITEDANCQTAVGISKTANVTTSGGTVAQVANSSSSSRSCRGAAPVVTNTSTVVGLGTALVPIPSAACANGVPDTVVGLPPLLPIVCNADDIAGAAAVREALDVFVLQVGGTSLIKETTAASESFTVAPAAAAAPPAAAETGRQCSDGVDNDGDGRIDTRDPGCHSDGNANNSASFNPNDDDETDRDRTSGSGDDGGVQCADNRDNDGDGVIDARDPGCHTDGDAGNPDSYDPTDDSEADGGGGDGGDGAPTGGQGTDASSLPFTGTDVVGLALAGLLMLAGGLLLRRREGTHATL